MSALQTNITHYRIVAKGLSEEHGKTEMGNTKGGEIMIFALAVL